MCTEKTVGKSELMQMWTGKMFILKPTQPDLYLFGSSVRRLTYKVQICYGQGSSGR